jgi:hypothetical protein
MTLAVVSGEHGVGRSAVVGRKAALPEGRCDSLTTPVRSRPSDPDGRAPKGSGADGLAPSTTRIGDPDIRTRRTRSLTGQLRVGRQPAGADARHARGPQVPTTCLHAGADTRHARGPQVPTRGTRAARRCRRLACTQVPTRGTPAARRCRHEARARPAGADDLPARRCRRLACTQVPTTCLHAGADDLPARRCRRLACTQVPTTGTPVRGRDQPARGRCRVHRCQGRVAGRPPVRRSAS